MWHSRPPADRPSPGARPRPWPCRPAASQPARTSRSPRPSTPRASSPPDGQGQPVEPDGDAQQQAGQEAPGRAPKPGVESVTESPEQDDGADERITCGGRWSRSAKVLLERVQGTLQKGPAVVIWQTRHPKYCVS